jgi:hypothetical protein
LAPQTKKVTIRHPRFEGSPRHNGGRNRQMKEGIRHREEQLTHLDATLRVLDPSYRADSIPPKRLRRVN